MRDHAKAIQNAIADGSEVIGYTPWSLTDLLSWLNGYQKRYGFVYIDRDFDDNASMERIKRIASIGIKKSSSLTGKN